MNKSSRTISQTLVDDPDPLIWESKVYSKTYFSRIKNSNFKYYDNSSIFKYLFFHWLNKWVCLLSKQYTEPYKYHPLPISDQVLKWQPIFSKHVSDGIVRLESYDESKFKSRGSVKKPYNSILLRALFLTIWKRALMLITGLIVVNVLSMSISILVKKLLEILDDKSISFVKIFFLLLSIILCQIADALFIENINFYLLRLICVVNYLYMIGVFQHGMCHRRKFSNGINGSNSLNVCNQVLHSCLPGSECSKNPLYCQALRHQCKDINGQIFNFVYNDSFYVSQSIEAVKYIVDFFVDFGYGVYLLSLQVKLNIWVLYFLGILFVFIMVVFEILNAITIKFVLYLRDYRLTKSNDFVTSLPLIKKMFYDDIAINIITKSRNNELSVLFVNMFLTYFNMTLYNMCIITTFYVVQRYFVTSVIEASVITDIDTAGFMTSFYIFLRIAISMFLLPRCIRSIAKSYVSFRRMGIYIKDCPPNFYISDNKFTGSANVSSIIADTTDQLPNDTVVYFRDASFTWVHTRNDLLNKKYDTFLKNLNFELKRGEIAIVTGSKGSGKSNFIKSMLGEMTLVGGSMAVIPLHTSMPIFYASQDIFLQQGTIRSNITFGYRFDEHIYNTVLKAVELEFDISTWDKGDLRVVSDRAHSLSGGQRVRMELARAVYAYLVFHQVNTEYNNSQCSFLMCLDASFHGLDPYVSKTIFNNLFNLKTGLLVKNDLSVVLTTSKQTLDICSKTSDINQVPNPPVYNINNQMLNFYSNLHDFIKNNRISNVDYNFISNNIGGFNIHFLSNDMLSMCSYGVKNKKVRMEITKEKYDESYKSYTKDEFPGVKFNSYMIYLAPCLGFFVIYLLINIIVSVMDNIKYVLSTRLSDYISKHIRDFKNGQYFDLAEIKAHSSFWLRIMTLFVSVIIVLTILSTILFSILSNITCRKIHEYVVDSIFKNSSSVIKVKKKANQVMTYLSCDTTMTDDDVGYILLLFLSCSIQAITSIVTLFYLIPISIPFFIVTLTILYKFILLNLINSAKNKQVAMLESMSQVNSVCENAISGSSIYRSYKNELALVIDLIENTDYYIRSRLLYRLILTWCTLIFKYIFSCATFFVFILPIMLDKFTKYKLKVGYFGLALSLCMNLAEAFGKFSKTYAKIEIYTCSLKRFTHFIPPGQKLKFGKFVNSHEEYIIKPANNGVNRVNKLQLLRRRAIEFKAENTKFYGLKRIFYHPKIHIMDVENYITPDHTGVELKNACVYTRPDFDPESMILKHLTVAATKSEIIGIVGRTGAGKTTLLSVLQNLSTNRTGQVLLDGKDLNDIPKVVLRQIIGVLPQLPFVFKGWTIRRFLDPRRLFTDDEINQALNKCALLNFVNELPGGLKLDTLIVPDDLWINPNKPKNSNVNIKELEKKCSTSTDLIKASFETDMIISNSQLRTLTLARLVLYKDFYRVIIVDEPPEEDLFDASIREDDLGVPIYDLLQKHFSHCTTFVTAHDVNVLKTCTSVWVIHEGCLVRTCKTSDIAANESIASIIEENVKSG
ncbi:ABC transporter [Theileria orientalis strain Shintoku]|uniref:ABC transporter n=1 Tax=Theileria orientalis strain Shintoku TaxID=869250 RepID=J7MEG0_THEOR|nr:ABC transporter [Theileria orientalis strain Shintoku]BAM38539.1 ABC transporter [Theileria orientalis strain Shintoku]|eukprot:XP_009688840.1 ABC transporter [Theileria orientalis strain Shintoku]